MITRNDLLGRAVDECLQELYSYVQPAVSWDDFKYQNEIYSNKYKSWEEYEKLLFKKEKEGLSEEELKKFSTFPANWKDKSITECIGPRPFEFYYLPKEVLKDICDSYIHAYRIDSQQELLDTIAILKNYCKKPIVDKYIEEELCEDKTRYPGHRDYDYPDNLEKEITKILTKYDDSMDLEQGEEIVNKFFEFLDMAGKFYNWSMGLNLFNTSVLLGPSPNINKEEVIENWKKYRDKDIVIDEEQIKQDYYGEELD